MGSDRNYPEEAPAREVAVGDFWIDETPVTNAQFARFIAETGYRTLAEVAPDPKDYPGMSADLAVAGSAVFTPPTRPVAPVDPAMWWKYVFGAHWRQPLGPDSSIDAILDHPVVQIAYADAQAYASWAGKSLPTEREWEYAARGGLEDATFAWGESLAPAGRLMANYWHGRFPWENLLTDGYARTSPVRAFPPNGFGLYDMIGNVWEWTGDDFSLPRDLENGGACCAPRPLASTPSKVL